MQAHVADPTAYGEVFITNLTADTWPLTKQHRLFIEPDSKAILIIQLMLILLN
jgi:hypothetical protein